VGLLEWMLITLALLSFAAVAVLQALLPLGPPILSFARCMSMSRMDFTSTLMDRFASTWKSQP
jgi:hypothetical protein